jgi:hypothetical protein
VEPVRAERLRLPLRVDRFDRLGLDRLGHEPVGLLAEQDLAGRRRLLESRRDVDRVARDERLAVPATTSPVLTPMRSSSSVTDVAHLERGARRAERVVLVNLRDAEHGHHRVADELLDAGAVALETPRAVSK